MSTENRNSSIMDIVEGKLQNISAIKDTSVSIQEFDKLKYPLLKVLGFFVLKEKIMAAKEHKERNKWRYVFLCSMRSFVANKF